MGYDHRNVISTPHWKGDGSSIIFDPNSHQEYKVPAKSLYIIWGNDARFWQWITFPDNEARAIGFKEGAILLQVNWIEVKGRIALNPVARTQMKFELYYVVKFRPDAFGWHSIPLTLKIKINGEEKIKKIKVESLREKYEIWHEINGGEFILTKNTNGFLEFGMFETESDWWKGGMVLAGIKIVPKN